MALVHTVTWEQVRDRAGLRQGTGTGQVPDVQAEAIRLIALALADLEDALEAAFRPMPEPVLDECLLTVAKAWADRRRTGGATAQTNTEGTQVRQAPRDTLLGVRPILARYTVGFA